MIADPSGSWEPSSAQEYIDQQIATVNTNIASETVARQTADQSLQIQINSEATTRANADSAINATIGTDSTSGTIKGRIKALENEVNTVDQRIQAEATARTNADTGLSNRITPLEQAVGTGGSVDSRITAAVNTAKSEIIGNATAACDTLGEAETLIGLAQNAVSAETSRAQAAEQLLQEQYNGLTQSDIIVGALPSTGTKNKIYRVPGTTSYSDYMWNSSSFVKMAEYNNAIDDVPTYGSNNLVKSGGVANNIDTFSIIGEGNTLVRGANRKVKVGNFYRIYVKDPNISLDGISYTTSTYVRFAISSYDTGGSRIADLVYVGMDTKDVPLKNFYDIVIPEGCESVAVRMRASSGAMQVLWIEDITLSNAIDPKVKSEIRINADFTIGDERKNDIAVFNNGHIQTKNFDSSKSSSSESSRYELAIGDNQGNDVLWVEQGYVKTKNFDSSKGVSKKPYHFKTLYHYDVECNIPCEPYREGINSYTALNPELAAVSISKKYEDRAVLYLPLSYTPQGKPTRLVICGRHGTSVFTDSTDFIGNDFGSDGGSYINLFPYLLSLGYALMAVDGVPDGWAAEMMEGTTSTTFDGSVNGNYVAIRSIKAVYDKIIEEYNICKDGVFCFGYSQGGWVAMNAAELTGIPCMGVAMKAPVTYLGGYFEAYSGDTPRGGVVVSNYGVEYPRWRYYMIRQYYGINPALENMTLEQFLAIPEQPWRWVGYDPFIRFASNIPTKEQVDAIDDNLPLQEQLDEFDMQRQTKFPIKIWVAKNDSQVGYKRQALMVQATRNAGMFADMRLYDRGNHTWHEEVFGDNIVGTFGYNSVTYTLYPFTYEVAMFFSKCGGNNVTEIV